MFCGMQLAAAQQYCLVTAGYAPLHAWVKRHMARMHTVPAGHDIIMTSGNNQTIEVGCTAAFLYACICLAAVPAGLLLLAQLFCALIITTHVSGCYSESGSMDCSVTMLTTACTRLTDVHGCCTFRWCSGCSST